MLGPRCWSRELTSQRGLVVAGGKTVEGKHTWNDAAGDARWSTFFPASMRPTIGKFGVTGILADFVLTSFQHGLKVDQVAFVEVDRHVLAAEANGDSVRLYSALFDEFQVGNFPQDVGR